VTDRILLIEDDRRLAEMVSNYLGEAGFQTAISRTGSGGIALHDREPFDVLILDLMLPDMDGLDVCRRIREKSETPILMLTARGDAMDRVVGLEMGADDYLPKPFTAPQLFSAVEARLAKHHVLKQSAEKKLAHLRANLSLALPHEMITPLNGIFGLAEILKSEAGSLSIEEIADYGNTILQSAERLHRTVQNFLLFGKLEIQASDGDTLRNLRQQVTAEVPALIETRARHLAKNAGRLPDVSLRLTDGGAAIGSDLLTKVVDEVIDNALKFSKPGTPIRISSEIKDQKMVVAVSDQGCGMSADDVASIGAYSQFHRDNREQQGSGLGLAIAGRIAELHNGTLRVQSQVGAGTTVSVTLPLAAG